MAYIEKITDEEKGTFRRLGVSSVIPSPAGYGEALKG
jgi:hypothetical protein